MSKRNRNRRRKAGQELDRLISGALDGQAAEGPAAIAQPPALPAKPEKAGRRKPPADWTAEDRKAFAQLPDDAQAWVLAREDAQRAALAEDTRQLAEQRRRHQALVEAAAELEEVGVDSARFLSTMIEVEQRLATDPEQTLGVLAGHYLPEPAPEPVQETVPPVQPVPPVQEAVPPVQEAAPTAQPVVPSPDDEADSVIDGLAAITDETGQPVFPHAQRLGASILGLLRAGLAPGLERAYYLAERLDDDLLQSDLDSRLRAARAADDAERQKAVQRARRIKPRRAVPAGASRPADLDGLIAQALNEAGF